MKFPISLTFVSLGVIAAAQSTFTVSHPSFHAVSPPMSSGARAGNGAAFGTIHPGGPDLGGSAQADTALQTSPGPLIGATGGVTFTGMNVFQGGFIPSDSNIAVGPNHIVEVVNSAYAVYTKTGATLLAPVTLSSLWGSLTGSGCATNNGGDTVVEYDRLADRWLVTQLGSTTGPEYSECIAVSQTNDPTGAFNVYSYDMGTDLNDYPKFGIWPTHTNSAYLATFNLFNGTTFVGVEICAYDRAALLAGSLSPTSLCRVLNNVIDYSLLPSDLDGPTPPLDGTPAYFAELLTTTSLGIYTAAPNFSTNTLTLSSRASIPVAGFTTAHNSPQPGTARVLDSLSDRLMYRLAFRMFSGHESMVVNHAVVATSGASGVRWYELQAPVSTSGVFSLFQQGTFSPDSTYRWMGSAAMDQAGDIALGYSASSSSVFPSVLYTGRVPSDPLGTMETEATLVAGSGSQTGTSRWGDYSSMRPDPSDDCTFWYVNEYLPTTSSFGWYTGIGSFKFSGCTAGPDFSISPTPASRSVNPTGSTSYTINVGALNGFTGNVTLSVISALPSGVTASFTGNPVAAPGSATLNITTSGASGGSYSITVQGANGSLTHTTTVTLNVTDFTLSVSPSSRSVGQGTGTTYTATVASLGGFSSSIGFSVSGLPAGATASFSPTTVSGSGTSTMTVTTSLTTPLGTYPLTVTGSSSTLSHTANTSLTVTAAGFAPIRINSGGGAYTDTLGNAWSADAFFTAGNANGTTAAIAGTPDQPLYQTWRYLGSGFSYVFPSIPNGNYTVALGFADVASTGTSQRLMNISINGAAALSNFDIFAAAGAQSTAVIKSIPITVTGGSITIQFTNAGGNRVPLVNNISIVSSGSPGPSLTSITPNSGTQGATVGVSLAGSNLSGATINLPTGISLSGTPTTTANSINATFVISGTAPTGPQSVTVTNGGVTSNGVTFTVNGAFTPIRINAGGSAYTDTLGHVWSADADFTAGNTNSTTTTIAGTPDQPLYQHWRYFGPGFSYVFPSIPNGSHTVTLGFADIASTGTGQRLMNISINGATVLSNFDIFAAAGAQSTAVTESIPVNVTGGSITIQFTNAGGNRVPIVNTVSIQ